MKYFFKILFFIIAVLISAGTEALTLNLSRPASEQLADMGNTLSNPAFYEDFTAAVTLMVLTKGTTNGSNQIANGAAAQGLGFESFAAFKKTMGPAGTGQAWHHIVEQNAANVAKFGLEAIHNTSNVIKLPHGVGSIHAKISGFYSSIQSGITGSSTMTVRQWLSTQTYQQQYDFGIQTLKNFGWTP